MPWHTMRTQVGPTRTSSGAAADAQGALTSPPTNERRLLWLFRAILVCSSPLILGVSECNFTQIQPQTIACMNEYATLAPGQCATLNITCNGSSSWALGDNFEFEAPPFWLSVGTSVAGEVVTRMLCVAPDAPLGTTKDYSYIYAAHGQWGRGTLTLSVTTEPLMTVTATATPQSIMPGQTVQLNATVALGTPPYTYRWTGAVSNPNIANPTASPLSNATYSVAVTDSVGNIVSASVDVTVGMTVSLNASASIIDLGQGVLLGVVAFGGTPPYTFSWSPPASLSDPHSTSPTATPNQTTTYQVTAQDSNGHRAQGSITIQVNLRVQATASPPFIVAGQPTQITATVLGGGLPPYTFSWTPTANLIDPNSGSTQATPTSTTTYTVTVTDSAQPPLQAIAPVTVTVQGMASVVACFTLKFDATGKLIADASCSTSSANLQLVRYEFTQIWNGDPSLPPDACFILTGFPIPPSTNCVSSDSPWLYSWFGTTGDLVRVRVVDVLGNDASASQTAP